MPARSAVSNRSRTARTPRSRSPFGARPYYEPPQGQGGGTGGTPSGLPTIQGYGKDALSTLGNETYVVSATSGTGVGSFPAAVAWLNGNHQGTITFASAGMTIDLGRTYYTVSNRSNWFIDGRGTYPTLKNGSLFIHSSHHWAIANVRIRNEELVHGDNAFMNDCIEIWCSTSNGTPCHDWALVNVSASGTSDETISMTGYGEGDSYLATGPYNFTLQDVIIGQANPNAYPPLWNSAWSNDGDTRHDYGSLVNSGVYHGSFVRVMYVTNPGGNALASYDGMYNRCPTVQWTGSIAPDSNHQPTLDMTNTVYVNVGNALTAAQYARVNNRRAHYQGVSHTGESAPSDGYNRIQTNAAIAYPTDYSTGYTVASGNQVAVVGSGNPSTGGLPGVLSTLDGAAHVRTWGGCLPHDHLDDEWVGLLPFDAGMTYTDYTPTGGITTISALQTWADANVKNSAGSFDSTHHRRILLGAGRVYTGTVGFNLSGYAHTTFEGGGTEVTYTGGPINGRSNTTGSQSGGARFSLTYPGGITGSGFLSPSGASSPASDIRFHCIDILGDSTTYATTSAGTDGQLQAGFAFYGASDILIDHCSVDKNKGDGIYCADRLAGSGTWCSNVTVRYSHFSNNGRQAIALIACDGFLASHCRFTNIAMGVFDLEPNQPYQGCDSVAMNDCIIDGSYYSWSSNWEDPAFGTNNQSLENGQFTGYIDVRRNNLYCTMQPTNTGSTHGVFGFYKPTTASSVKTAILTIDDNRCTTPKNNNIAVVGGWVNGGSITNNVGFKTASGTWFNDQGGNVGLTVSGNS